MTPSLLASNTTAAGASGAAPAGRSCPRGSEAFRADIDCPLPGLGIV
jgi:hypothetical protein